MQKQYKLITAGSYILDLGCAPGAWLQVLVTRLSLSVTSFFMCLEDKMDLIISVFFLQTNFNGAKIVI